MTLTLIAQSRHRNASRPRTMRESPAAVQRQAPIGQHLLQRKEGQCTCGGGCPRCLNHAVLQPKLAISTPGDPFELEADRVAEAVMRMPTPTVQRACAPCAAGGPPCPKCEAEKEGLVQRKAEAASDAAGASVPDNFLQGLGPGLPLDPSTRAFMEPRFGHDFSRVRVHTDAKAAESARAMNALAYTVGRDVVFGTGQYAPGAAGQRLLAHELTHTVQQNGANTIRMTRSSHKHGPITVRWSSDDGEFFRRTVASISRRFGVPESSLFQPVYQSIRPVFNQLDRMTSERRGRTVNLEVDFYYERGEFISTVAISLAESAPEPGAASRPAATASSGPAPRPRGYSPSCDLPIAPTGISGEPIAARMRRQAAFYARFFSRDVESKDEAGYEGMRFVMEYRGPEGLEPSLMAVVEPQRSRSGRIPIRCESVDRDHLRPLFESILMAAEHRGPDEIMSWEIQFNRDDRGSMQFHSFQLTRRPISAPVAMPDYDIPDRRAIYAGIFQEAERQLIEAGIMVAGIALQELAMWVAGGVILRGLGLLGRAGLRGFSSLRAALRSRQAASELGRALQTLAREEADDFARIMRKVQDDDTLTDWEMRRLRELMGRIDSALGRATVTTIAQTFRLASPQVWRYSGREIAVLETSEGLQAFYRRTGLGPGRPAGHAGAQAGDWAPFDGFIGGDFAKSRYFNGIDPASPLYSFGSLEFREASQWVTQQALPVAREMTEWRPIQLELQRLGARVAMIID